MIPTPNKQKSAIKAAVRLRDGMRCVRCGKTNKQLLADFGKSLHVHRLRPGTAYSVDGCVTVCSSCHPAEAKRSPGEPDVEYGRLGKAIMVWLDPTLRDTFDELVRQNRRSLTQEVAIALENHLKAAGLWPPQQS